MAHSLPRGASPRPILALAALAVAEREGVRREDIADAARRAAPAAIA